MTHYPSDDWFSKNAQEHGFLIASLRLMLSAKTLTVEAFKEVVLKHLESSVEKGLLTQEFADDVRNNI